MNSRKRLTNGLKALLGTKQDKPEEYPGLLGVLINDQKMVQVELTGPRRDYVWVRLRGSDSDLVKAFNDQVGLHYDLPVIVVRDKQSPQMWRIARRDVNVYKGEGWGFNYVAHHGEQHSFGAGDTPGADVTWIYKRQFMPMLVRPSSSTGSMSAYVEGDIYQWGEEYKVFPGTGTVDFTPAVPGAGLSRFMTVYIDGDTNNPGYITGSVFSTELTPSSQTVSYIPLPTASQGLPVGAVLLTSDTEFLTWANLYDIRAFLNTPANGVTPAVHALGGALHSGQLDASRSSIVDVGNYYTGSTVEQALQEVGARVPGHVIKNPAGTAFTQRANLRFATSNFVITDDAGANATLVEFTGAGAGGGTPSFSGCRCHISSAQTITTSTWTAVLFPAEDWDTAGYHSTSSNTSRFTIPADKTGYYLVTATEGWAANTTGFRYIAIAQNGTRIAQVPIAGLNQSGQGQTITDVLFCAAGDYIELHVFHDRGSNLDLTTGILAIQWLGS